MTQSLFGWVARRQERAGKRDGNELRGKQAAGDDAGEQG